MDRSLILINAQIQFLDGQLALIHIPLKLYPHFLQPILQLLALIGADGEDADGIPRRPWAFYYPFAQISITAIECSVVCPRHLVTELFSPILDGLSPDLAAEVSITREDYVAIAVGGEGTEAGQRVLDLTAPLALAGISIFFITSYYSDFVLVPQKAKATVITALESQGFAFSQQPNGHSQMTNVSSPIHAHHHHHHHKHRHKHKTSSVSSAGDFFPNNNNNSLTSSPQTPPAESIADLQTRTFALLRKRDVHPRLDPTLRLTSAAGHRSDRSSQSLLVHHLTRCLILQPPPRFLSLTLSDADSPSLTLDRDLLRLFPGHDGVAVVGGGGADQVLLLSDEVTVPISLDLRGLPDESTGIVCGVAGRLLEVMHGAGGLEREGRNLKSGVGSGAGGGGGGGRGTTKGVEMSYLSTARGGNVIVGENEVEEALAALRAVEGVEVDGG